MMRMNTIAARPRRSISGQRPSVAEMMMRTAFLWAERSTCPKRHVGAVIATWDGRVLATGYNGAPSGVRHCDEDGCDLDGNGDCSRAVHAEANAIAICAKSGVKTKGTTIYVTAFPCHRCAQLIAAAGIEVVIYAEPRKTMDAIWQMAEEVFDAAIIQRRLLKGFEADDE